jgi:hypothetical protein
VRKLLHRLVVLTWQRHRHSVHSHLSNQKIHSPVKDLLPLVAATRAVSKRTQEHHVNSLPRETADMGPTASFLMAMARLRTIPPASPPLALLLGVVEEEALAAQIRIQVLLEARDLEILQAIHLEVQDGRY